ncbi:ATP-binding protein [Pseudarthrobacter sp. NPDC092424]|uniref:ATP-binding protein n=1 Tax=Pseudarthrobacter sp. NPDC092424 TaxID=3364415 RepID=UPI0037FB915F
MGRGALRIFLGAAPGAGKTFAMLEEGCRLRQEGKDVVVGVALSRGRSETEALLAGLEFCPATARPDLDSGLDLPALLDRAPQVVLVDDYAAFPAPGAARWEQVPVLLDAGIDVLSTLDIRNVESLRDVVEDITGARATATVPDAAVLGADQIELVDASPELLRQRLGEGRIFSSREEADSALAGDFRPGTLAALRELALIWLAERVDAGLADYRVARNIRDSWPAREKLVVGLSGRPRDQALLRRAARMLAAAAGGELHAVHIRTAAAGSDARTGKDLELLRRLTREVGGVFHSVGGQDTAAGILDFARSINASQIVLGTPAGPCRRRGIADWVRGGGVAERVRKNAGNVDIHLVATKAADGYGAEGTGGPARRLAARPRAGMGRPGRGRVRQGAGFALAVLLPALLQFFLGQLPHRQLSTDMLVHLSGVVAVSLLGGVWAAVLAALVAGMIVNYFSVRPVGSLFILDPENVLAILVFLVLAVAVSLLMDRSVSLRQEAKVARAEAAVLGELSRRAVAEGNTIPGFLEQVRDYFQVDGAALWTRTDDGGPAAWRISEHAGGAVPGEISAASTREDLDGKRALTLTGRELSQDERRLLAAFGAHLLAMLQREQLSASQRENLRLAEGNTMRTSILRAVSHDLRTPLAGIKLASSSLRDGTIAFSKAEEQELLATIEAGADRLDRLVSNLLDMSRITADAVSPLIRPVYWADVVAEAVRGTAPARVRVLLPDNMPPVDADPGMLERVIANLVENALKYAPGSDVVIAGAVGGAGNAVIRGVPASELTIVDHGAGIPAEQVLTMFRPFQRADDTAAGTGIGLGLAVAKGFVEAMGGVLLAEPTPGGGLTMVVRLPLSTRAAAEPPNHWKERT